MNAFQYFSASSVGEALEAVGKKGRYLAGGIDLLGEMKDYLVSPDVVVDVKNMVVDVKNISDAGDRGISASEAPGADWKIGALVTVAELAEHPEIKAQFPGLAEAAGEVGSPQIRNVATLGGNLLQHSRCWYYRQPDIVCLKRGGGKCYAPEGENKYLALFSGCACVTAFTSNLGVMLSALDARVTVRHAAGKDAGAPLPLHKLYEKAWSDPLAHHSLPPSSYLARVSIPATRNRSVYRQMSEKSEFDWALVSCGVAGQVRDGKIYDARIALGAVAPVPYLVEAAHDYLEGKELTDAAAAHAADLVLQDAKPLSQNGYKLPLARTLIRRTLLALNT